MVSLKCCILTRSLLMFTCIGAPAARAAAPDAPAPSSVIQLQVPQSQHHDPVWLTLLGQLAWPAFAVVALIALRKPLVTLLGTMATPGTEFTVGGLAVKLPAVEKKLAEQQQQIDIQSSHISRLITLSMSWYIYQMLYELDKAKKSHGQYLFRNDGSMDRNIRFLIDHGYLQEVYPIPADGEDFLSRVVITQAGDDLISMRGSPYATNTQGRA